MEHDQLGSSLVTYRKLPGLVVVTDMDHMHRIFWSRYFDRTGRAEHVVDKARKATLLSKGPQRFRLAIAREPFRAESAIL